MITKLFSSVSKFLGLDINYFIFNSSWIFIGTVIAGLLGTTLSSLASRTFSPESFGKYSFLFSILTLISITALPGMNQAVIQAATEGKDGIFKQAKKIIFRFSLIGSFLFILGAIYFFYRQNYSLSLASFILSLLFPFFIHLLIYIIHF